MSRLLLVILLIAAPPLVEAQVRSEPVALTRSIFATPDAQTTPITGRAIRMPEASPHRLGNALIGGVIGAAAGAVVCTAISNIADDSAVDRFTTCTTKGYLLTGGIGFGAGFLVGWLGSS